jgi:hypothetical protein
MDLEIPENQTVRGSLRITVGTIDRILAQFEGFAA